MLKKMRLDESTSPHASISEPTIQEKPIASNSRRTTVEDVLEDAEMDTSFAPGGDADYYVEEDDEGRFYGGGLTREQKEILSVFERAEREGVSNNVRPFCALRVDGRSHRALVFRQKRSRLPAFGGRSCGWNARSTRTRISAPSIRMTPRGEP